MKSSEFCYWLQGLFELQDPTELTAYQTEMIKKHLALVFAHELDKTHGDQKHQDALNDIHGKPSSFHPTHAPNGDVLFRC